MIGGTVIEVIDVGDDRIWVNCQEDGNVCAVYIKSTTKARCVYIGDSVWWQGGSVYWTPKGHTRYGSSGCGEKLEKIGYSGVTRP